MIFAGDHNYGWAADPTSNQNAHLQAPAHWSTLTADEHIGEQGKIPLFKLRTDNGSVAYLAVININDKSYKLAPFFYQSTGTTSDAARRHGALLAINGGYFNLSDAQSTSYIFLDGKSQCEPRHNKALVGNLKLKPYLSTVFNRSELRILKNSRGDTHLDICRHNKPIPSGWLLDGSVQAGPQLLPELTAQAEAFVRTNPDGTTADSIGSRKPAARTACGITPDGQVLFLCVASKGQDEFSSGVTLEELAEIFRRLGCDRAINFDGGTSTTMTICAKSDSDQPCSIKQVCGRTPEKFVKSGLMTIKVNR
jgi:hypothetical protein